MKYLILILIVSLSCLNALASSETEISTRDMGFRYPKDIPASEIDSSFVNIIKEITFHYHLRHDILSDSVFAFNAFSLSYEKQIILSNVKKLDVLMLNFHNKPREKEIYLNIGRQIDSVFKSIILLDAAIKHKVDSLYAYAYNVCVKDESRYVVHKPKQLSIIIQFASMALMAVVFAGYIVYLFYSRKLRIYSGLIVLFSVVVFTFGILFSEQISNLSANHYKLPIWEQSIRNGYMQDHKFQVLGKSNVERQELLHFSTDMNQQYLKTLYTIPNKVLLMKIDYNMRLLNTVLFPPVDMDGSTLNVANNRVSPVCFSQYNYSKIPVWNRMVGRKVAQGGNIKEKEFRLKLYELASDTIEFQKYKVDSMLLIKPYEIPLEVLKKIRPVMD